MKRKLLITFLLILTNKVWAGQCSTSHLSLTKQSKLIDACAHDFEVSFPRTILTRTRFEGVETYGAVFYQDHSNTQLERETQETVNMNRIQLANDNLNPNISGIPFHRTWETRPHRRSSFNRLYSHFQRVSNDSFNFWDTGRAAARLNACIMVLHPDQLDNIRNMNDSFIELRSDDGRGNDLDFGISLDDRIVYSNAPYPNSAFGPGRSIKMTIVRYESDDRQDYTNLAELYCNNADLTIAQFESIMTKNISNIAENNFNFNSRILRFLVSPQVELNERFETEVQFLGQRVTNAI